MAAPSGVPEGLMGGVVWADPLVTISKHRPRFDLPLGLLSTRPDLFVGRRSLNFLGLSRSQETDAEADAVTAALRAGEQTFPLASFVVLANTDAEREQLARRGVRVLLANELIFTDETRFRVRRGPGAREFDAAYVAGLRPYKRHHLAAGIPRLLLLYYRPARPMDETMAAYRALLPQASFVNHAGGDYRYLPAHEVAEQLNRSVVGLCLSAIEGPMRASMEYLLCGLAVVTTPSRGGRARYLVPPLAATVEPDAEAVAEGVARLVASSPDPGWIRESVLTMLRADRQAFERAADQVVQDYARGLRLCFADFAAASPNHSRPRMRDILAGLDAAP